LFSEHGDGHHLVGVLRDCQHGHLLFGLLALLCQQLFALGGGLNNKRCNSISIIFFQNELFK